MIFKNIIIMRKFLKIFAVLALFCYTLSCSEEVYVDDNRVSVEDNSGSVALTFSVDEELSVNSVSTRAYVGEEVKENLIHDMWLMFFDADSMRIEYDYMSQFDGDNYLSDDQIAAIEKIKEIQEEIVAGTSTYTERQGKTAEDEIFGSTYIKDYEVGNTIFVNKALSSYIRHIRVVGNIDQDSEAVGENFTNAYCGTINDYNEKFFKLDNNVYRESDMWTEHNSTNYLRMAGNWDGTIPPTGLDFNLAVLAKPTAAKITVNYTCTDLDVNTTVSVSSVQITRVPQNCFYKDVEYDATAHNHKDYTSYHPRNVVDCTDGSMEDKSGSVYFYVPQNMRGTAGTSSDDVTQEELDAYSPESIKSLHPADSATCVIITGTHRYYDEENWAFKNEPIYIQLYPGANNYDNYDIQLRRHYIVTCNITAKENTADWETDYRVSIDEVIPGSPIVHYEFNPVDKKYNSAYKMNISVDGDTTYTALASYPRLDPDKCATVNDNVRKQSYSGDTEYTYYNGYVSDRLWDDSLAYVLPKSVTNEWSDIVDIGQYSKYIYGFTSVTNWGSGTNYTLNAFASEDEPFIRNLAVAQDKYDYTDGSSKKHPQVFDCSFIKDNGVRSGVVNGTLSYTAGRKYIDCSYLQLSTGWGRGIKPSEENFTIVFIGAVTQNTNMSPNASVYYGNSIEWNKRWYFYIRDGYITYGIGEDVTIKIPDLVAENAENVQSYDVCSGGERMVYFNNVDVQGVEIPETVDDYYYAGTIATSRPSTTDNILDSPISIFGHTTDGNKDDAVNAELRLFLIYDYALSIEEIDQIRRYAALKGLLLYGDNSSDDDRVVIKVTPTLVDADDGPVIEEDTTDGGNWGWDNGNITDNDDHNTASGI